MKASELRKKSVTDLQEEILALVRELFNLRIQKGTGQTPQAHSFSKIRREIARIKTILAENKG